MSETRVTYKAEYLYPGSFFPESAYRDVPAPTWYAVNEAAPADEEGYFRRDGWYAVKVHETTSKRFVADDGEIQWVKQSTVDAGSWIIGESIHYTDIDSDGGRNDILISNIRANDRSGGYGVKTRAGNWQIASDWDRVIAPVAMI